MVITCIKIDKKGAYNETLKKSSVKWFPLIELHSFDN